MQTGRRELRQAAALVAASLGMFLCALDLTVNVALPAITGYFRTDMATVQWIIILYVGTTTALQLALGRLADTLGLKRAYVVGILTHSLAVAGIGLASSLPAVLALRIGQAVGYGLILSTGPALVSRLFEPGRRGRALGLMTSVGTAGMITATLGGGVLVDTFGWQAIFLARLPVGLIALVLALALLDDEPGAGSARGLDVRGSAMLVLAIALLVLFFNTGGRLGWLHPGTLAMLGGALSAGLMFFSLERRARSPTIDTAVFTPVVIRALAAAFLMSLATFINLFILPYFVSDVVGASATSLGLLLMLPPALGAIAAPLAGSLSDRYSPRMITTGALGLLAFTMLLFAGLNAGSDVVDVGLRLAMFGVGMGAFQASNTSSVMGAVAADRLASGGAALALANGLGVVTSVGVMTAVFNAFRVAAGTSLGDVPAFVEAFSQTYLISAVFLAGAVVISGWGLLRGRRTR